MGEFNINDLIQKPQLPMKVTPLQFIRVLEVEWLREKARVENFKEREFAIQRIMNFREMVGTLQVWESIENEEEITNDLIATVEAQMIPQKNEQFAIQYVIWHIPTNQSRRYLSILGELGQLPSEAARATAILNGMLDKEYRPSLDLSELAETSTKSKRGRSLTSEMQAPSTGGAMSTRLAEEALGLSN